jgi:uncharacterized protein YjbI with pentapeptide repeats
MPATLEPASGEHDLVDEVALRRLDFTDLDLAARTADSVEFQQCRFTRTTLAGAGLERASFADCQVDHCDWAPGANCTDARFTRCDLAGLGSVASLAGALIAGADLTALARSLAGALGIVIADG